MSARLETDLNVSLKPLQILQNTENYLYLDLYPTTSRSFDFSDDWRLNLEFQVSDKDEDQALTTNANLGSIFDESISNSHQFDGGLASIKPTLEYGKISRYRIGPITTDFKPGPTLFQVNPHGFNGYENTGFLFTLEKVARVEISSFTQIQAKRGTFELTWETKGPVERLLLSTEKHSYEVSAQSQYRVTIKKTQKVLLQAFAADPCNRDIKEEVLTVSKLLNQEVDFVVDPHVLDPKNPNNFAIYLSTVSKIELSDTFKIAVFINDQDVKTIDKKEIKEWTPAKPIELFLEQITLQNPSIPGISPRLIVHINGLPEYEDQLFFQILKVKRTVQKTKILEFYTDPESPFFTDIDPSSKKAFAVVDIFWRVFGAQKGDISFTKGFINLSSASESEERTYAIEETKLEAGSLKTKLFYGQAIYLNSIGDPVDHRELKLPIRSIPISEIGQLHPIESTFSFNNQSFHGCPIILKWEIMTNCHLIPIFNHPTQTFFEAQGDRPHLKRYVPIDQKNGYPSSFEFKGLFTVKDRQQIGRIRNLDPPLSFKLRSIPSDEDFYESEYWIPLKI